MRDRRSGVATRKPHSLPANRQERLAEVAAGGKEEVGMSLSTLSMKSLVVIALVALLVVAVTLAVLLVPSIPWAAGSGYEWFTHPGAYPCACVGD
jgi:hypothetical protein